MTKARYQDLSTFKLPENFRGRSAIYVQLWWIVQSTLLGCSPQVFYGWRRFLLRLFGAKIGPHVLIRPTARVTFPWKVEIGEYSQIGDHVELYSLGNIKIGAHCVISQGCYVCTASHYPDRPDFAIYEKQIVIADEVWLAAQCFVMPGVHIGRGVFAYAGSLITKDIPEGTIVSGRPAKYVRDR
ncbi:MAG: WcaF family extracellular polysaccharide biosynthesis acetyltransferase [Halothiobacillaceae bacterium]